MAFPSHVALQAVYNKKFLSLPEEVKPRPWGHLQFSGDNVYGVRSQLELEKSESDGGLVHVRCLYNNKYWERLENGWISVTANQQEEDRTKKSCTLFKPIYVDQGAKTLRLQHVQSGFYTCLWRASAPFDSCLYSGYANYDQSSCDVFTIFDLDQMFNLPRYVAFNGENDKYLKLESTAQPYLQFSSDNVSDEYVANEVYTNPDGTIRVKSVHVGKFWSRDSSNWIQANSNDTSNNNMLFSTFKVVEDDVVALRNSGNNLFCKRFTYMGKESCLNADKTYIDPFAKLKVEELVLSRRIYNVKFRIDDVRIYNKSDVVLAAGSATNNTDKPTNLDAKLSYAESKTSSTWMSLASTKLRNVPTTLESGTPRVDYGMIQMSGHFQETYQWGVTREWRTPMENAYAVAVPPKTKVAVKVIATICSYDVPFLYTQRDTLTNGNIEVQDMDDGKYTGTNYFSVKYVITEEKLQDYKDPLAH